MRFGLLCSAQVTDGDELSRPGQGFFDYLELNVEAEAFGFHASFLVEHHFSGWGQVSSPLMLLACLASRTTTLRLGTGVLVLPWHNPVLLAEQVASLDLISGGRVDLGIGRGYRHSEFVGFQLAARDAQARFDEALQVMALAWTSRSRFSHRGKYWTFEDIIVEPAPAQRPHPPVWLAAGSEASVRLAAANAHNLLLDQYASPSQIAERLDTYRDALGTADRYFDAMNVAVARQVYVAKDQEELDSALRRLAVYNQRIRSVAHDGKGGSPASHILAYRNGGASEEHALYGSPGDVRSGLLELQDLGVEYVLFVLGGGAEQLRRLAEIVLDLTG